MNIVSSFFTFICTLLFIGCSPKDSSTHSSKLPDAISNPEITFEYYKALPSNITDSIYDFILSTLAYEEQYDLLEKHLAFYQKINSNTPYSEANAKLGKGWIYINRAQYDSSEFSLDL